MEYLIEELVSEEYYFLRNSEKNNVQIVLAKELKQFVNLMSTRTHM